METNMNIAIASNGSNIKTGDLVLARNGKNDFWKLSIFYRVHVIGGTKKEYECLNDYRYYECVPYESNQELAGTNQRCKSYVDYIPKIHEHVNFTYAGTKYLDGVVIGFNNSNDDEPLYTISYSTYSNNECTEFKETIFKVNKVEPIKV